MQRVAQLVDKEKLDIIELVLAVILPGHLAIYYICRPHILTRKILAPEAMATMLDALIDKRGLGLTIRCLNR